MHGKRSSKAIVTAVLLAAALMAGEPPAPVLSTEQKLEIREARVAALQSSRQLADFMARIQAQLDAMPEYRKLKLTAEAAADSYAQAVQKAVLAAKCEGCQVDPGTLVLIRRSRTVTAGQSAE
jgi:hypothetical protein